MPQDPPTAKASSPPSPSDWNARYEQGQTPWDSGVADHHLAEVVAAFDLPRGPAIEIGCGTGTNAIELARLGFAPVLATDLSPRAIDRARDKARSAQAEVAFHVHDILSAAPIPGVGANGATLVFDRGVFHSVDDPQRPQFAQRVADLLGPQGWWLSLSGNADDPTPGGPPRLTASHIAAIVEPLFEVHAITRSRFRDIVGESAPSFLNWQAVLRKR